MSRHEFRRRPASNDERYPARRICAERSNQEPARSLASLTLAIATFGMFYGGVMGTYGGFGGPRMWQVVYSALKVPFLLFITFLLSLPSFFVVNTLLGLRADFPRVIRALLATQAGLTIILSALAPYTAFWYVCGSRYQPAILFNGVMFAVASGSAQWMLRRSYRPLIKSDPKHRWMLFVWLLIYVFVGIQMAWVLRPFIGHPAAPCNSSAREVGAMPTKS